MSDTFDSICQEAIKETIGGFDEGAEEKATQHLRPLEQSLSVLTQYQLFHNICFVQDELKEAADEIHARHERDKKNALAELSKGLKQYEITADEKELEDV